MDYLECLKILKIMPSVFLSHTSFDKPFVEKLANDLIRLGIKVWFDKWEIKTGESLTWKIEEGIRANEYLGIVLSPQALASEWVRSELGAAWVKQMNLKKVIILPILYQDCDVPLFLQDRKYADFRNDYSYGLGELASGFGIKNTALISPGNWRKFTKDKFADWKKYKEEEFSLLVTNLVNLAIDYNWSSWVGRTKMPYSICLRAFIEQHKEQSISVRLDGKTNAYMATLGSEWNPNRFKANDFNIYVGNTVNEVEEFVWRVIEDFKMNYGIPLNARYHHTEKFSKKSEIYKTALEFTQKMNWYRGLKKLPN